ncbi:unnamed protein product [Clavelina lepadiformis]|uniref:Uncharacterized protein n=1 Tax=Clavelina lepadiformis TaxID=159417 RepID=A0ABP0FYN9_CLALP
MLCLRLWKKTINSATVSDKSMGRSAIVKGARMMRQGRRFVIQEPSMHFHHTQTEGKNGLWQCAEIDGFPPNTQKFARIVFLRNILIEQGNETGLKMVLHQLVLRNFLNI